MITMKERLLLFFLFFVFYIQIGVEGALSRERTDPRNCANDCCGSKIGPMRLGEVKQVEGRCLRASCERNGVIVYASCGAVGANPPCYVDKGDLSKPYPECCPQIRC